MNTFQLPQPGQRNAAEIRESCDFANAIAAHRDRVAAFRQARFLDNIGEPIGRIKAADAKRYGIPF